MLPTGSQSKITDKAEISLTLMLLYDRDPLPEHTSDEKVHKSHNIF